MDLRTWRKNQNLTLAELRSRLPRRSQGIALSTLSRIEELRIKRPQAELLIDIELATGAEVSIREMTPDKSWVAYVATIQSSDTAKLAKAR